MPNTTKRKKQQYTPEDVPQMNVIALVGATVMVARKLRIQFIVPECMLFVLLNDEKLGLSGLLVNKYNVDVSAFAEETVAYLDSLERVPARREYTPRPSSAYETLSSNVSMLSGSGNLEDVFPSHFFQGLTELKGTEAKRLIDKYIPSPKLKKVIADYDVICRNSNPQEWDGVPDFINDIIDEGERLGGDYPDPFQSNDQYNSENAPVADEACYRIDTDEAYVKASFEGRVDEIKRSLLTLLKGNKSNIVFVGERGVGKSSMIKGLIKAKASYSKRSRIGGAHFYKFTPSAIVTGVSYADEIENHVAQIVEDIENEKCMAILFADNMAELMPQHQNDNTPDTLRLLTSLIDGKDIHIITTASFEQYKRLSSNSQTLSKFFTRIDIAEPPIEPDARLMFKSAARGVLELHRCLPSDDNFLPHVFEMAVSSYTKDIAMPGRAIDLLDNVGASLELENSELSKHKAKGEAHYGEAVPAAVDRLLKKLGYDTIATAAGNEACLRDLEPNLLKMIFGQDEAVHGVSESVLLAKAGLSDDTKPLAAYLFVGPTGVGKTELAKVLASELGTKLVRFDMSEYSEQHTVSKLVGSPAGYIGYDDGGLLTDAVRKTPNCVLLFDEIEKAHSAVFNLLLQVLDYAQLTDNKGQKADFSGAIIIMTSNAGARFATGRGLGFGSNKEKSEVMGSELKRVFAPEFLNRLTQIVAFHDMSKEMAERILDRKVSELQATLAKKRKVSFSLTPEARQALLDAGFSSTYGAREMDRSIGRLLKPALMQALLFRDGVKNGDKLTVRVESKDKLIAE